MVSDAPHLILDLTNAVLLPLFKRGVLSYGAIEWVDDEESFDVWPQYAVAALIL